LARTEASEIFSVKVDIGKNMLGCFLFLCILAALFVACFYVFIWGIIAIAFIIKWMAIVGFAVIVLFFLASFIKSVFD
jgi:hypothetical protein